MAMSPTEDEAFTRFLRSKAQEAQAAVKYTPTKFLQMLGSNGGYETAVSLLRSRQPSDGFVRLWEAQRLDLSVEALVLESRWRRYFNSDLLSIAEKRLKDMGYRLQARANEAEATAGTQATSGIGASGASGSPHRKAATGLGESKVLPFVLGKTYTRSDVFKVLGIQPEPTGGPWFTGYTEHNRNWFIFCNVGAAGRTGHDYDNHFDGDRLVWLAKGPSKLAHPSIQKLLNPGGRVYVFFRSADRDPFTFAGTARPLQVADQTPVKVVWDFYVPAGPGGEDATNANEAPAETVVEGAAKTIQVKVYERDRGARLKCIERWGWKCFVCTFDFASMYGALGENFIHVHHLKPLGQIGEAYELDPVADLRPVCPNCHAMLHRKVPALSVDELKDCIQNAVG